ncbi:unnamed protein product [Adineta steineri]|uniref:Uncharacterized protein n=1 Tax=Adineta steineri TaxID=433720 RepID=A0A819S6B3_9BILA|nr:unnamed protein product [Adineta steineri]CAF4057876.1 unnamed protein product [Adineta steineri]
MLYSLLEKSAKNHPDTIALWSNDYSCTYFELNEKVKILSAGLLKEGLQKGDRIASYLHSSPEAIQVYFACFKIGVSVVVINPFFREFEINLLVETAQPKLFITERALYENIKKLIQPFSPIINPYYLVDFASTDGSNNLLPFSDLLNTNYTIENIGTDGDVKGDQEAVIQLTSGSTGKSKCVQTNHNQKLFNVKAFESFNFDHNDKFLVISAMNTMGALDFHILPAIQYGSTICFLSTNTTNDLYIKQVPPILYEQNITYLNCISSTLRNIIKEINNFTQGIYRKNMLRYVFVGGERFPDLYYENAKKCLGMYPRELYGMTETNGPCAITADNPPKCGRFKALNETIKFRITNENWEDMPHNTSGEITIYSKTIMTGYLNDEKTTQQVIKDGWLKSGDMGYLESNGTLNIVGRIKQMVICNGCNVNLIELEETLLECDDVHEACATSVPYMEFEKPVVFVSIHSFSSKNIVEVEQYLFSYLKKKLAVYKIPLYIRILDKLPKNTNGKIDRKMLKDRALEESIQD